MSRRLLLGVILVAVWVALWGNLSLANLLSGLVVAAVVVGVFPIDNGDGAVLRLVPALRYAGLFVLDLLRSSIEVARLVVGPKSRITQGIVEAPIRATSPGIVTLVANSISLTPGTLTIEVQDEPPTLYVHCLGLDHPDQVRRDVLALQANAIRAFGSDAEVASLDDPDPVVPPDVSASTPAGDGADDPDGGAADQEDSPWSS